MHVCCACKYPLCDESMLEKDQNDPNCELLESSYYYHCSHHSEWHISLQTSTPSWNSSMYVTCFPAFHNTFVQDYNMPDTLPADVPITVADGVKSHYCQHMELWIRPPVVLTGLKVRVHKYRQMQIIKGVSVRKCVQAEQHQTWS